MSDIRARWLGLCLSVGVCAVSARATVIEIATLEDLVAQSDLIVQGEVQSAEGKLVSGHIETTVKVKVSETWKGSSASEDLVLTQLGGTIEEPIPLGQAVPGLPAFAEKEKVVLFLSTKPPKIPAALRERTLAANGGQLPALWTSPKVIGGFQGKYNVYHDPKTKKDMVIRQSSLAAQGTDPAKMPAEVQARIAESVSMAERGTGKALAEGTAPDALQLSAPAPSTAIPFDKFRQKIQQMASLPAGKAAQPPSGADGPTRTGPAVQAPGAP